jgi:Zn-dependent protease with chaperone function
VTAIVGWLRGLLAVGLLAGFYVLAFVLVVVDVAFVAFTLWAAFESPATMGNWTLVIAGSIPAVFALLYGVSTVSRAETPPPGAVLLRRREAPELWRLIEDLAAQLNTRPPSRVYLTSEVNASVSEEAGMLGFTVGERTLYLGVPLLIWLTPTQLRAVLCHEFGHYAGRHTRFGAITYRGAASLDSTLFRLRMTAQSGDASGYAWLFKAAIGAYARVYLWLSLAVRRRQEIEADAMAARVAGPAATAGALRAVHALGYAWAGFLDMFVRPVQRLGYVPEDLFEAFAAMADDPFVRERLADLREHPVDERGSALDSHPPLARRLLLIEALPAKESSGDDEPLLTDRAPIRRVEQKILAGARTRAIALPLVKWADLAAEAFPLELASLLLDAARGVAVIGRPTLGTVLDLLEAGKRAELASRLTDAPEPEQQLAEALYALAGQALVGAGRARWELSWTKGYLLVLRDDTGRDLESLVDAAARDSSAVDDLRDQLELLGVDVAAPVPLALRTVSAPGGRTTGVRVDSHLPDFVVEELERQRRVRTFTIVALVVLAVPWGIGWLGSDESDRFPTAGAGATYTTPAYPRVWPSGIPRLPGVGGPGVGGPGVRTPLPLPSFGVPPVRFPYTIHRVERGETLTGVACRYTTTIRELQELNDMGSRTLLNEGETLLVPIGRGGGVVEAGCR